MPDINNHSIRTYNPTKYQWTTDINRLVLYAEITDFEESIFTEAGGLYDRLQEFRNRWDSVVNNFDKLGYLQFSQFSSSILIAVNGDDCTMFEIITKAASSLMQIAIEMSMPIKGVIAQGLFCYDEKKQLYFGKPLVDAYILYQQINYYGIVVHHSAEKIVKKYKNINEPYVCTPIFLKSGQVSHYHLCWNLLDSNFCLCDITNKCEAYLEIISENISGSSRKNVDNTRKILREDAKEYARNAQMYSAPIGLYSVSQQADISKV